MGAFGNDSTRESLTLNWGYSGLPRFNTLYGLSSTKIELISIWLEPIIGELMGEITVTALPDAQAMEKLLDSFANDQGSNFSSALDLDVSHRSASCSI